jgi:cell division protein FtsQ
MSTGFPFKLAAWGVALTLVALPILGVLNGWFASDRWPVTRLNVNARFDHVSAEQIRAAAQPLLGKGFFALDLDEVRAAVARLPWVERAEVRKRWPDTVDLTVFEQQPFARWGSERLVNRRGELFSVAGADGLQGLPRLSGPDDRLDDVLRFHAECQREFTGSGLAVAAVALSPRGGWRLELASGTVVELGRDDAQRRLTRFLDVWPRLAGTHASAPAYIDLRYENGFAMRWPEPAADGNRESGIGNGQPQAATLRPVPDPFPTDPTTLLAATRLTALAIPDSRFPIPGPP